MEDWKKISDACWIKNFCSSFNERQQMRFKKFKDFSKALKLIRENMC